MYTGQWRNGKRHGSGEEVRPDGTTTVGEWLKDALAVEYGATARSLPSR